MKSPPTARTAACWDEIQRPGSLTSSERPSALRVADARVAATERDGSTPTSEKRAPRASGRSASKTTKSDGPRAAEPAVA